MLSAGWISTKKLRTFFVDTDCKAYFDTFFCERDLRKVERVNLKEAH